MTDPAQFRASKPSEKAGAGPLDCAAVELWLTESAEKTLSPEIEKHLHAHAGDCPACDKKLAQAFRGREWLLVLKQEELEPPADLVSKILARTSLAKASPDHDIASSRDWRTSEPVVQDYAGQEPQRSTEVGSVTGSIHPMPASVRLWQSNPVVVLRRTVLEPRLALVAAMAFFSISLTLNLMGIRLGSMHAADLTPHSMRRAITRQYADTNARVVRYYENLRVVYEVEARVQQIRRASETIPPPEPEKKPRNQSFSSHPDSRSEAGTRRSGVAEYRLIEGGKQVAPSLPNPTPIEAGPQIDAELQLPQQSHRLKGIFAQAALTTFFRQPRIICPSVYFECLPTPQALSCSLDTDSFSRRHFLQQERRLA